MIKIEKIKINLMENVCVEEIEQRKEKYNRSMHSKLAKRKNVCKNIMEIVIIALLSMFGLGCLLVVLYILTDIIFIKIDILYVILVVLMCVYSFSHIMWLITNKQKKKYE